jgi:hypothetical protein
MENAVAMIVEPIDVLVRAAVVVVIVAMIVVDVPVLVTVHDAVGMAMRVRMLVVVLHDALFRSKVGKTR